MRNRRHSRAGSDPPGQSLVEIALVLPVVLLLMLGTIDLGRCFFDYIEIRNAAFEGARYGARNPSDTAGIESLVRAHGVPTGTSVDIARSGDWSTIDGNGVITVTTRKTFRPFTTSFLQEYFSIGAFTMRADAVMRVMT